MTSSFQFQWFHCPLSLFICVIILANSASPENKGRKKSLSEYSDADFERLAKQWEDSDEDPLSDDEKPAWERPPPQQDLTKMDLTSPEALLKSTKKGQNVMLFVAVSGQPDKAEAEMLTIRWQRSLFNAHIEVQVFPMDEGNKGGGSRRAIFMVIDGARAWEVKEFLVAQERCESVTLDGKVFPGKGATKNGDVRKDDEL